MLVGEGSSSDPFQCESEVDNDRENPSSPFVTFGKTPPKVFKSKRLQIFGNKPDIALVIQYLLFLLLHSIGLLVKRLNLNNNLNIRGLSQKVVDFLARLHEVQKSYCSHPGRTRSRSRSTLLKFSRSLYLGNHSSESIHTWTIGTQ